VAFLSEAQRAAYHRDGWLVVEGFADGGACDRLVRRSYELIDGFDPATVSVFTTDEQVRTTDDYFLGSREKASKSGSRSWSACPILLLARRFSTARRPSRSSASA
jgi:hypothetical protein